MSQHFLTLHQVSRRQISSTVYRQLANKVLDKQKLFQERRVIKLFKAAFPADD